MRILLTDHLTPTDSGGRAEVLRLAEALYGAGHDVRCLVADEPPGRWGGPEFPLRRVVFSADDGRADLPFPLPRFEATADGGLTFGEMSDQQIAQYRETFRQAMDELVEAMDPQVIHCQHAWVHAHLALETGAPYVLSVWGPELDACRKDARYRRFVEEGAANAGRLLVPSKTVARRLAELVDDPSARIVVLPDAGDAAAPVDLLADMYRSVFEQRFGPATDLFDATES